MECCDCRIKLTEYLAGALDGEELMAVEHHLNHCPHCLSEMNVLKKVDFMIEAADISIPEMDLTESIMMKIREEAQKNKHTVMDSSDSPRLRGYKEKRFFSVLQDLVTAASAAIIIFWFSGPLLSTDSLPDYSQEVVKVSDTVGGAFQNYINLPVTTLEKLSDSFQKINSK